MNRFFDRHKKTIIWVMVIGFFLGSVGLAAFQYMRPGGSSSGGGSGKEVALVVNDEKIYESELQQAYEDLVERQKSLYSQFGRDFSQLLQGARGELYELRLKSRTADSLVEDRLVKQEAKERGIDVKSAEVEQKYNEQLDSILERQGWTMEQLKRALSAQETSYEEFKTSMKENIRRQLNRQELRNQIVGTIDPTDQQLSAYYQKNIDTYVQSPSKVKAAHLTFEKESRAKEILEKVKTDPDYFQEYAEERDLDPSLGWFEKGEKSQPVEELAFSLEVGEVGGPIETGAGWEILKVLDKQERKVPPLEEIKEQVRKDYVSDKEQEKYDNWYQGVKEEASIEIKLPAVKAYRKAQEGFEEGLEAYQQLKEETSGGDSYVPYYIGRLYQQEISRLEEEKGSEDDPEVKKKIEDYRQKAVSNYMEVVRETGSSDGKLLNRVIQLAPENAEVNYYLGQYYFENKQYSPAAKRYRQAIESRPDYLAAHLGYGKMLVELQNYQQAAEQYEKALELAGDNVTIMNNLARAYLKDDQYEEAKETYQKALENFPNNFAAQKGLGDLYLEQGDYEEAIDYYNDALSIRADADTALNLGRAYLSSGQLEEAKDELDNLLGTNPYNAEAYMLLGDYYRKKDLPDRALEEYKEGLARTQNEELRIELSKRVVELAPGDLETRFGLAQAYRNQHIYDAAIDQYEKILNRSEEAGQRREAYLGLGKCFTNKTDYGKAKEYYRKGLELAESSIQELSFYEGLLEADEGENGEDQLSETGKEALLKIAEIKLNQGDTSQAKEKLNRLSEMDPEFKPDRVQELLGHIDSSQ